jgi:hypothetical protein
MDVLPCGHVAVAGTSRMCRHLLGSEGGGHVRLLTGRGLERKVAYLCTNSSRPLDLDAHAESI